jgi:hypothetical protein
MKTDVFRKDDRTKFECHAGAIMAGVTLRGDDVTLAK